LRPAVALPLRRPIDRPALLTAVAAVAVGCVYIASPPHVPDLAAQVARANIARTGVFTWWTGWFGGVSLPSYSPISPVVMARIGVALTGVLSAVVSTLGAHRLFRGTRRPALGLAVFTTNIFIDLFCGRVTFALGFAGTVVALGLMRRGNGIWACGIGALSFLASPLAGLFLGIAALTVAVVDPLRRRNAICLAGTLLILAAALGVLAPEPGQMPFPWWHMAIVLATAAVVAVVSPQRYVRWGCAFAAIATVIFFVVPGAVGTNIDRLAWLTAAPAAVACADIRRLRLAVVVAALLVWPTVDLGIQLADASTPAASQGFYQPLLTALTDQQGKLGAAGIGERVEVVDPATQWSAAYLAPGFTLARGWDRQLDRSDDALFYDGTLTTVSYRHWLSELAVGWVALPRHSRLDYASVGEARVVRGDPAYLRLVWQNANWQLYRVRNARPLVRGATVSVVNGRGVTFQAARAGAIRLQLRWSPFLTLASPGGGTAGCITARGSWTTVNVSTPGTYTVAAGLVPARPSAHQAC
jgi:hypothetical protein